MPNLENSEDSQCCFCQKLKWLIILGIFAILLTFSICTLTSSTQPENILERIRHPRFRNNPRNPDTPLEEVSRVVLFSGEKEPEVYDVTPKPKLLLSGQKFLGGILTGNETLDLAEEIQSAGNILMSKMKGAKDQRTSNSSKCGRRPKVTELRFSNTYWQVVNMRYGPATSPLYSYGAYLDTRGNDEKEILKIRILIVSERILDKMRKPNFCQIWFPNVSEPVFSPVESIESIWTMEKPPQEEELYHPYLVTCNISKTLESREIPESVSLVESKCDSPTNELKINYEPSLEKKDFGICVKTLDFPVKDISSRIVQWIEMMRILGFGGIHFSVLSAHPNVPKTLNKYVAKATGSGNNSLEVTVKYFSLPGFQPNLPVLRNRYLTKSKNGSSGWKRQEVIPLNDCFLKHMYKYKYIATLDIDQVILPTSNKSTLKDFIPSGNEGSICFQNLMFVDTLLDKKGKKILAVAPEVSLKKKRGPYMMTKLYNVGNLCQLEEEGDSLNLNCVYKTDKALILQKDYKVNCLHGKMCPWIKVNITDAYVHHHKDRCQSSVENIPSVPFNYDPTILKYRAQLVNNSRIAFKTIFFKSPSSTLY